MLEKKYLVIDFGGILVKYSIMTADGQVNHVGEEPAPTGTKEKLLEYICKLYHSFEKRFEIAGIAISMPGVIDSEKGYVKTAGAYTQLCNTFLVEELKTRIPIPVTVENDGKCGALAEVWKGGLKECNDGIVLILGTALAGGIIKDRKIHKGRNLAAGEFSWILMGEEVLVENTALVKCGVAALLFEACRKTGIDVKKCSGYDLFSTFMDCEQKLSDWNDLPQYENGMAGYQFFELLENKNPIITELYEEYTKNLAKLILNLSTIYNPEKLLVGGGISRQKRLIEDVRVQCEKMNQMFLGAYNIPFEIESCRFQNEANQYGALHYFLKQTSREVG